MVYSFCSMLGRVRTLKDSRSLDDVTRYLNRLVSELEQKEEILYLVSEQDFFSHPFELVQKSVKDCLPLFFSFLFKQDNMDNFPQEFDLENNLHLIFFLSYKGNIIECRFCHHRFKDSSSNTVSFVVKKLTCLPLSGPKSFLACFERLISA